jgi:hypothetical protein
VAVALVVAKVVIGRMRSQRPKSKLIEREDDKDIQRHRQ